MKRTLAILLALMMVLSTVSFAAPVAVSTVTTAEETQTQAQPVTENSAELEEETVDWIDDTYGHLVFNLDFEKSDTFTNSDKMSKHGNVNPKYSSHADWWINQTNCGTVKIASDIGGNSYLSVGNGTAGNSQIMFESGLAATSGNLTTFTGENGYYTHIYDLRYNTENSFRGVSNQSFYRYDDSVKTYLIHAIYGTEILAKNFTLGNWKTIETKLNYTNVNENTLIDSFFRFRPVVYWTSTPTANDAHL